MDRLRQFFSRGDASGQYEPLDEANGDTPRTRKESRFDWIEYAIFALLGVAMLWAWYVHRSGGFGLRTWLTLAGICS